MDDNKQSYQDGGNNLMYSSNSIYPTTKIQSFKSSDPTKNPEFQNAIVTTRLKKVRRIAVVQLLLDILGVVLLAVGIIMGYDEVKDISQILSANKVFLIMIIVGIVALLIAIVMLISICGSVGADFEVYGGALLIWLIIGIFLAFVAWVAIIVVINKTNNELQLMRKKNFK
ncbi:MAG: tetraspanin family protein [Malacoplasma sp.]|nr:tetraspanin family protein [Malacoplasma sp.]